MKKRDVRNKYGYRIKVSRKRYKHLMAGGPKYKRPRILGKVKRKWNPRKGEPVSVIIKWDFSEKSLSE